MSSEPEYIAFDPGEHTGWATFDGEGQIIENSYCTGMPEIFDFLYDFPYTTVHTIIVEEYRILPNKQSTHAWSDVPTLRVIGALEYWAYINKIKIIMQPPSIKPMGYKYMHATVPRSKIMSHQVDAMAHGVYYLQLHKIRKPIIPA